MSRPRRVLMIEQKIGRGVDGDPIRNRLEFYYEDTLEFICHVDPYLYSAEVA